LINSQGEDIPMTFAKLICVNYWLSCI